MTFGPNLEAETEVKVQFSGEELYGKVIKGRGYSQIRGESEGVKGVKAATYAPGMRIMDKMREGGAFASHSGVCFVYAHGRVRLALTVLLLWHARLWLPEGCLGCHEMAWYAFRCGVRRPSRTLHPVALRQTT